MALNAYFVATEFCAVTARLSRLEAAAEAGNPLPRLALAVKKNLPMYLSATQLGVTISSLGLVRSWSPPSRLFLRLSLTCCGSMGETRSVVAYVDLVRDRDLAAHRHRGTDSQELGMRNRDEFLPLLALPLVAFSTLFYPLIWLLSAATTNLLKLGGFRMRPARRRVPHTADELRDLLEQSIEEALSRVATNRSSRGHSSSGT